MDRNQRRRVGSVDGFFTPNKNKLTPQNNHAHLNEQLRRSFEKKVPQHTSPTSIPTPPKPRLQLVNSARQPINSQPPRTTDFRPRLAAPTRQPLSTTNRQRTTSHSAPTPSFRQQIIPTISTNPLRGVRPDSRRKARSQKTKNKTEKRTIIKRSALAFVLIVVLAGGWLGWTVIGNLDKVFHGNVFSDAHALFSSVKLKGESQGRVNLLLMGNSVDDPGHAGAILTDSIMVISVDTVHHTGFILSIPRDSWVDVPGYGHEKINAAIMNTKFHEAGYPSGGIGQLEQIINSDYGIPIDYYALIDYSAFRDAVNAVGGIRIDIQSPDPRGLYDAYTHLKLPNGWVTLNGQQALDLARARGDNAAGDISYGFPNSDFNRTQHQRQMLVALEQKALSAGVLTNPIRIGQLFNAIGNNVKTDLNLQDVLRLDQLTKNINLSNITSVTYSFGGANPLLKNYTAPDGEEALIPSAGLDNFSQIQHFYLQLTSPNPIIRENASVAILNGANVPNLALQEENKLKTQGFNVVSIADASTTYPNSMIVDLSNGKKPQTKKALQNIFKNTNIVSGDTSPTEATEAQGYNADFVIILGQNSSSTTP